MLAQDQRSVSSCIGRKPAVLAGRKPAVRGRKPAERSGIELAWLGAKARWTGAKRSGIELTGEGESPVYACGKSVVEIFGIFQKYRTIFEL